MRFEQRSQLIVIDAKDKEIGVGSRFASEQFVPYTTSDEICVEPERADVVLELFTHSTQTVAIASISTSAPEGSAEISTVDRAGRSSPT